MAVCKPRDHFDCTGDAGDVDWRNQEQPEVWTGDILSSLIVKTTKSSFPVALLGEAGGLETTQMLWSEGGQSCISQEAQCNVGGA